MLFGIAKSDFARHMVVAVDLNPEMVAKAFVPSPDLLVVEPDVSGREDADPGSRSHAD